MFIKSNSTTWWKVVSIPYCTHGTVTSYPNSRTISFGSHQYNLPQTRSQTADLIGAGESSGNQEKNKIENDKNQTTTSTETSTTPTTMNTGSTSAAASQQRKFAQQSARENKLRAQRSHITF